MECSDQRRPLSHPPLNSNQSKLDDFVDALATRYAGTDKNMMDRHQKLVDSPVQKTIVQTSRTDDWKLWRVKCAVSMSAFIILAIS